MVKILHSRIPPDILPDKALPGVAPLQADLWFRVDEAYAEQMAYRRNLLRDKRQLVLEDVAPDAQESIHEVFAAALERMPSMGFQVHDSFIVCPDGVQIDREADSPLAVLGRCLQEDICILIKKDAEHILAAAVLCFPASWTLSEKIGRPLTTIHVPVPQYDDNIARRVQRLFDGVRVGVPLWRNNFLRYDDPDLFQPLSENDPQRQEPPSEQEPYIRAERQIIFRLPKTQAVVFSIHSYVVAAQSDV